MGLGCKENMTGVLNEEILKNSFIFFNVKNTTFIRECL